MQKILWIGSPFFSHELADCGWAKVHIHNFEEARVYSWNELVTLAGFVPDVLVVADKSRPPFVLGMEEFPCITVFYSVDSHIHSWQNLYAQGFDACLVSLKDNIPQFQGQFIPKNHVWWSPPFAKEDDQPIPGIEAKWDCLFVGSNDKNLMPKRALFLESLKKLIPDLKITRGNYHQLFPQAKILLNQSEHADLNFRVFEAMGSGGCLVTPRINHGLQQMFVDGEHLVFYNPDDAGDAAYRINFLLQHPDVREHISRTGLSEIDKKHRSRHRAQAFTDHLCDLYMEDAERLIAARKANAARIRDKYLSIPYLLWANEVPQEELKKDYLAAAKGDFGLNGHNGL